MELAYLEPPVKNKTLNGFDNSGIVNYPNGLLVVDSTGNVINMKGMAEEIIRNERLAAMSELSANIAHEIRNPLGCIELFASSLKSDSKNSGLSEMAESISKCVTTINSILSNINLFFKSEVKPTLSEVNIHEHLDESLFFSKHLIHDQNNIKILKNYSDEFLHINGDNELLKQMSMNIILNAVEAIHNEGDIEISTRRIFDSYSQRNFVEICYADTGTGICSTHMKKVFDPFFTTKGMGQGLGLSIVHNIVKLHGGIVQIKGRNIKGTEIRVLIPLLDKNRIRNVA